MYTSHKTFEKELKKLRESYYTVRNKKEFESSLKIFNNNIDIFLKQLPV